MRLSILRICPGLPHVVNGSRLLASRGRRLLESNDLGKVWRPLGTMHGGLADLHLLFRPAARLLRRSISNVVETADGTVLAIANRQVFSNGGPGSPTFEATFRITAGSRPMHRGFCATRAGHVYLAEYSSNPERQTVKIFCSTDNGKTFQVATEFPPGSIRHVHAVQEDPFNPGTVWVACGDYDDEAKILVSSNRLQDFEEIGIGDQTWRVTAFVFTPEYVYWGMDSPDEPSWIYRFNRKSRTRTRLVEVGGPVYYGYSNAAGDIAFATTVEHHMSIPDPFARIWASRGGGDWENVQDCEKDAWPAQLFQYGTIYFPDGLGPDDLIIFGCVGIKKLDNCIVFARMLDD